MADQVKRGWRLIRCSFDLLRAHKRLFVLPFVGYVCKYALFIGVITPFVKHREALIVIENQSDSLNFLFLILSFMLFLFFINLILFFFNASVIENLLTIIKSHQEASIFFGLKQAIKNYCRVYLWALYAGTFGVCVNLIPKNTQSFKKIAQMLHHNHWSIANFFALIQVIDQKYGPIRALKKSAQLVHDTWGAQVQPTFTMTGLFMLLRSVAFLPLGLAAIFYPTHTALLIGGGLTVLLLLFISTCYQMLNTTIRVVCYCYATDALIAKPFTQELLEQMFRSKNK